jgi:hypothetical protein
MSGRAELGDGPVIGFLNLNLNFISPELLHKRLPF